MLIRHLIFKNLSKNIKDNVFLFIGITINNAFLFWFLSLRAILVNNGTFQTYFQYERLHGMVNSFTMLFFCSGIFLSMFVIVPYMKGRIREYGLLLVLGIRKKMLYAILGIEYLIIWAVTITVGILIGLLFVSALYVLFKDMGYPVQEIFWIRVLQGAGKKVVLSSIAFIGGAILYLMIRITNQNLTEFAQETSRPEKQRSLRENVRICICGVALIILSFTVRLWSAIILSHSRKETLALCICIVGMYLIVASGMALALVYIQRQEKRYVKYMLSVRNLSFKMSVYKNTVFAVLLIHFGVLFYVGSEIDFFSRAPIDYSWRYPHDIVAFMKNDEAQRWEEKFQDKGLLNISFFNLFDTPGREFIGIPLSQYKRISSGNISLNNDQVVLVVQKTPTDLEASDKETSITFLVNDEEMYYDVKEKNAEIFIMGYTNYNVVVFKDDEYKRLTDKINNINSIIIQDIKAGEMEDVQQEIQRFQKEAPDATWIVKKKALAIEAVGDRIFSAIKVVCGVILMILGIFILSVKFFGEIPNLKRQYKFFRDIGMSEKQRRTEFRREILQMVWIPAVFAIFMAFISETELALRYLIGWPEKSSIDRAIMMVESAYGSWLCLVAIFILIQIVYGKYIISFLGNRVLMEKEKKPYGRR